MEKLKLNKSLIYKILLIAWLAACSAIIIYLIYNSAHSIAVNNEQLESFKLLYDNGELGLVQYNQFAETITEAKRTCIIHIVLYVFCLASFCALVLREIIKAFNSSIVKNGENIPRE